MPAHFWSSCGEGFCALALVILFLTSLGQEAFELKTGSSMAWDGNNCCDPTLLSVGVAEPRPSGYGKKVIPFGIVLSLVSVFILAPWAARNKALRATLSS